MSMCPAGQRHLGGEGGVRPISYNCYNCPVPGECLRRMTLACRIH
jgi:hypothetical protein